MINEVKLPNKITIDDIELIIPNQNYANKLLDTLNNNKNHIGEFLNKPFKIKNLEDSENYIKKINNNFDKYKSAKYTIQKDNEIIGMFEIIEFSWKHRQAEFGYWLIQNRTGKGYISKCLQKMEELLFDLGFERLVIRAATENTTSQNVAKRNKYIYEGTFRHCYYSMHKQGFYDTMVFSKLKEDFKNK